MRTAIAVLSACCMVLALALPGSAASAPPPGYFVDEPKLPFDELPGSRTTRYWGIHNGAGYRVEVPANWNGDLVLYAHGYRGTGLELTVSNPSIRQYLVTHGYAWAASSYSKNGYDVKQGVLDTHALGRFFTNLAGPPRNKYLMGHSMGGHITGVAIEQYPSEYVGALPMCGVMGDTELFDFFLDFQLVAQALAGHQAQFPSPPGYEASVVPAVKLALGPAYPNVLNAQGEKLRAVTQQRSGGTRPFFNTAFAFWGDFLFTLGSGDGSLDVAPGNVTSKRVWQTFRPSKPTSASRSSVSTRSAIYLCLCRWNKSTPGEPVRAARRPCSCRARSATSITAGLRLPNRNEHSPTWSAGSRTA